MKMKVNIAPFSLIIVSMALIFSGNGFSAKAMVSETEFRFPGQNVAQSVVDFSGWDEFVSEDMRTAINSEIQENGASLPFDGTFFLSAFDVSMDGAWARAVVVPSYVIDEGWENLATTDIVELLLGKDEANNWNAYLYRSPDFFMIKDEVPESFIDLSYVDIEPSSSEEYSFPWKYGQSWWKNGGWHKGYWGLPNNAIDFQPKATSDVAVLAASHGTLNTVCDYPDDPNQVWLMMANNDGTTGYGHIDKLTLNRDLLGKSISRGTNIGNLYNPGGEFSTYCGSGTATHLHFVFPIIDISMYDLKSGRSVPASEIGQYTTPGKVSYTSDNKELNVLFSDTFTDGNFDGWTVVDAPEAASGPSDWSVVSAKGSKVLLQDSNIHTTDGPNEGTYVYTGQNWWRDYQLNVEIEPDDNDGLLVLFRYVDDDNYYRFNINKEGNFRRLEKKVDGVFSTLAEDQSAGYGTDGWINIQIIISGTLITAKLDYLPIFSVNDASHTSGKIGVGTWASTGAHFDNIIVATSDLDPYADLVVEASIKASGNKHTDPVQALGRPQFNKDMDYVSVGGPGYWFVVDMGAGEEIVNGPGNDFRVNEIGYALGGVSEEYNVSVSNSPSGPWIFIAQGWTTSEFDLEDSGLDSARYVRIDDLSTRTVSPIPGSDIDAIECLNMEGDPIIEAPGRLTLEVSGNDLILQWDTVNRAEGYHVYVSQMGGGVGYSLLDFVPVVTTSAPLEGIELNSVSYIHEGAAGKGYFYVVTAVSPESYVSKFSREVPVRFFIPIVLTK